MGTSVFYEALCMFGLGLGVQGGLGCRVEGSRVYGVSGLRPWLFRVWVYGLE